MSGNAQKTPFLESVNRFAERRTAQLLQLTGKSLPASLVSVKQAGIVEVKIEISRVASVLPNVVVPIAGSEYIRYPLQAGMKGWVKAADARIGNMSGLGASTSDLSNPANLSALVWEPMGNTNWPASESNNKVEIYGVHGIILKNNHTKDFFIDIQDGQITLSNKNGTVLATNDGTKWHFKGPTTFDDTVTMSGDLQLAGNIKSGTGSTYSGNILTTGGIEAGVGGADHVTMQAHIHAANNTPPTPGH